MKVKVYWNTRKKLLSVQALEGAQQGKVVAHVERLMMRGVEFRVSEAGRQRVLLTKRKNVHAGAVGEVEALWGATLREGLDNTTLRGLAIGKPWRPFDGVAVRYNPYETATFVNAESGAPVARAEHVILDHEQGVCKVFATGLQ